MGLSGNQRWTWTLWVFFCGTWVAPISTEPHYMVTMPAILEAGAQTKLCAILMEPNETLTMTVTLALQEQNIILHEKTSGKEFLECIQFQVPSVENEEVTQFEVEVRGNAFYSKDVRKVQIKAYQPLTLIQTDKPIYLPGQTVHFRVVSMDTKFRLANQMYNIIELEDTNNNRIGQWLNETSSSTILQLSYNLNSEAREGTYRLSVTVERNKIHHYFKVEKYVLPKFSVTVDAKDEVSVGQEEFETKVCSKYTYGQPVPGSVTVKVCRPLEMYGYGLSYGLPRSPEDLQLTPPCETMTKQMDKTGCTMFEFKMSSFTKIDKKILHDRLDVSASMEEEGTGISHSQAKRIAISYVIGKLAFVDLPKIYDQGSNLEGKVKAVHYNDTPIPDMSLYLFEGNVWSPNLLQNLTTDTDGFATFSLSTETLSGDVSLSISSSPTLEYPAFRSTHIQRGNHRIQQSQPPSDDTKTASSLKIKKTDTTLPCDKEVEISIDYTFVREPQGSVDLMYLVVYRGAIGDGGQTQVQVEDKPVTEGEVSFKLTVSPDMAPLIQFVAYAVLPSKNVIAHSAEFSTEKCFSNKVSVEFSPSPAVPGEVTKLQLTSEPNSLCGVSAVDQSVLIKEPGRTLNEDKIFSLLPVRKITYIPYQIEDPVECLHVRPRRYVLPYPSGREDDAHSVFKNVGLKTATNLVLRTPSCLRFKGREYYQGIRGEYGVQMSRMNVGAAPGIAFASAPNMAPEPVETVRTFFPETWIWNLVETGPSGTKDMSLSVPDTITTWETETFCLSPQGFGLAPRQKLTVFQPFFLELTLPYSIIRGENFELKATVFNYLTKCIMVKVTAAPSSHYTLTPLSGDQYTSCLCANERKTLSWTMNPTALGVVNVTVTAEAIPSHASCDNEIVSIPDRGRIDTVTRPLIVKAEGVEVVKTHNWLLCPKGEALTEETEIQLPQNVIDGSGRAAVSVLGDILGRALQNLDGLLQMPYGCGEQNMALLAPNIYILEYLEKSNQLTPAIKEKASNFLSSGYQRQLNYKDRNGAYSTFGTGPGNTWLTAFVLRSFSKAKSFVYIDPEKLEQSKVWLEQNQNYSGCFQQSGSLFNNRMKGGVSDEVTLSAYITAAFLEMKISSDDLVVKNSLLCLKESINDFSNTYTTALLAYVFTLAGDMETRAHLLQHLDSVAIKDGGFIHWSQTAAETSSSLSVEISSYVLLAKLSASHTAEDLGYASGIVRWLTTQQNYYGGFSSTQDTVVALQALSLYSSLVFSPEGSSTVTVQSPSGPLTFDVTPDNKLLYQEKILQGEAGKYSLEVKGTGCASVQISQHYNIPPPPDATTMSVEVLLKYDSSHRPPKASLELVSQYSGKEESTNMVILDITLLSGFIPDPQSLTNLEKALLVDRVEHKNDHVVVYLAGLVKGTPINHSLELLQKIPVENLKPAVIALYDYYQPTDRTEKEYNVANQA
ncbi:alpha-2-macroglobulin-like isoform X1 [Xiphophorus hellerii]|uniref:alpha-2-macroglobulin-like isoform X1 n=1 Tax=Xiphophorus hellerii TaxID=8084 RepID=UPI0013B3FAC1|nr:alpha-2-macroglobulin-like isoform X1 [Xiphophorus hellerii]